MVASRANRLLAGELGQGQHFSGLLTGSGVHVEVLEEDLGATGGRSATHGVVLGLDVDSRSHRRVRVIEGRSLAIGTGDTVALRVGCLDDEFQVGDIAGDVCGVKVIADAVRAIVASAGASPPSRFQTV